ncbi:unnamed protein product, partial [Choristocarpus tenellus]
MATHLQTTALPGEEVDEVFENQRIRPFEGWSGRFLLKSDPGRYSDHDGGGGRDVPNDPPPPGWEWVDREGWALDTLYTPCDPEGWTYATSFRDFTSANLGLPAPVDNGTRVRRRRYTRRRRPFTAKTNETSRKAWELNMSIIEEEGEEEEVLGDVTRYPRESERDSHINIEVVIHDEGYMIHANPNDTVTWLHSMAAAEYRKEHNFVTHTVEV